MSSTGGDSSAPFAARGVASVQCWCDGTPNSTLEQTAGMRSPRPLNVSVGHHEPLLMEIVANRSSARVLSRRLVLVGGATVLMGVKLPAPSHAQAPSGVVRVGILWIGTPPLDTHRGIAAFRRGLRELGYTEGRSVSFEYRGAEGKEERLEHVEIVRVESRGPEDIELAMQKARRAGATALLALGAPQYAAMRAPLAEAAIRHRLPAMTPEVGFADAGGLLEYGPDIVQSWHRAAWYVDKVAKGAKPAELPVEQPTEIHLTVNLTTARTLGLVLSPSFLACVHDIAMPNTS